VLGRRVLGWVIADEVAVEIARQGVDGSCELGVRLQFLGPGREVMVGLGARELGLSVLADHDERREEDRLE
jgi:hypothetical protein